MNEVSSRIPTIEELSRACADIWEVAWGMGLRPFPMHYEIVPAAILYEFGAYGMPGRFSHWSHGKAYHQMKTEYDYGLSKIYELVVNTNPCYAFLLDSNGFIQNKLIIAHVLAHSDFFANNAYFAETNRHMLDTMPMSAERIRGYEYEYGKDAVESVIDAALAICLHLDTTATAYPRRPIYDDEGRPDPKWRPPARETVYDDVWEERKTEAAPAEARTGDSARDLLLFIARHSPDAEDWQRDVINIIREEMRYFRPQMQTKICNEGWASYWHTRILRELDLTGEESLVWMGMHGGVVQPGKRQINPYYLGYKILEDIEKRWSEDGKYPEKGREKLFEVRELEADASLLRNYLTKELCEELDLYVYVRAPHSNDLVVSEKEEWEIVRDTFAAELSSRGIPIIVIDDGDFGGMRELYMRHVRDGRDLDLDYAKRVMERIHHLWGRNVYLETSNGEKKSVLAYNAKNGHSTN